jgi:hypothetical protein
MHVRGISYRVLSLTLCLCLPLAAKTLPAPAPEPGYVSALATADRFLHAWQSGDLENGMVLLTGHAKDKATADAVEKFFSNPVPSAYEIGRGKLVKPGQYEFPVVLVTASKNRAHRKFSTILIVDTGGNDWAVDKLP